MPRPCLSFLTAAIIAGTLSAEAIPQVEQARGQVLHRRFQLGLDEDHDFTVRRSLQDPLGHRHVHLQQTYRGVKVMGGELITHTDAQGESLPDTNALLPGIHVDVKPGLPASEALAIAHADLAPRGAYAYPPTAELVIHPLPNGTYRLAYHVHTQIEQPEDLRHTDYLVDAQDGAILRKWNTLRTADAVGTGRSQYSGTVSLHTNSNGALFELKDVFRSMNISTINWNHGTGSAIFTDADNVWGDGTNYPNGSSTTSATGQTAGVDAHFGAEITFDFYRNLFGRNGIDGTGKALTNRVHYGTSYDNLFWDDTCFCMSYGDGSANKNLTAPDLAAHEMSHGVCSTTAGLTYSGESGDLNEASSDILGNMIELYARNNGTLPATVPNTDPCWTVGEQVAATPLRYLYKPSLDLSSPDAWSSTVANLDVHYGCGPADRMFFFLSQGASSTPGNYASSYTPAGFTGIGPEKAVRIWYRALTTYMTSTTTYAGAKTACLQAATDLYGAGSAEYMAVQNAFTAINIGYLPPPPYVSITPASVTLAAGASFQFTATVTNTTTPGVTWSCTGGTISASGLYTAPATAGTYTVRAASVADVTRTASATVTVTGSPVFSEVEANNTLATANAVPDTATKITGTLATGTDLDFFRVSVKAGATLKVAMTGPSGKNYDLYLYSSSGTLLKSSTGSSSTETVSYRNSSATTATYVIKVLGYRGASSATAYTLTLTR